MWIPRKKSNHIKEVFGYRPAILVTGARQVGKTSLLAKLFPEAEYVSLDKVIKAEEAESNPESFLTRLSHPVIIDEIQYAPSLFRELKIMIDRDRNRYGQWILTGSQKFQLMKNVSESLAGRIGIIHLETLCFKELENHNQVDSAQIEWMGGYPELWANPQINFSQFFEDYLQTYLERDLQMLIRVNHLRDFQKFMRVAATRVGQLLNYAEMAKDIGVSPITVKSWITALEASGLIYTLAPYFANLGKRLIKAPKLYFSDNGLLCHLLDIQDSTDYENHLYKGNLWENFVFTELFKSHGWIPNQQLFFYRDQNGVEIDFVVEHKQKVKLIEAKCSEIVDPRKLHFNKVKALFPPQKQVTCFVACKTKERQPVALKEYTLFNPTLSTTL